MIIEVGLLYCEVQRKEPSLMAVSEGPWIHEIVVERAMENKWKTRNNAPMPLVQGRK